MISSAKASAQQRETRRGGATAGNAGSVAAFGNAGSSADAARRCRQPAERVRAAHTHTSGRA
eukprot:6259180-Prymnesium_polylepis.1